MYINLHNDADNLGFNKQCQYRKCIIYSTPCHVLHTNAVLWLDVVIFVEICSFCLHYSYCPQWNILLLFWVLSANYQNTTLVNDLKLYSDRLPTFIQNGRPKCANDPMLSLTSHASKLLLKVLLERMRTQVEREVPEEQACFRPYKVTQNHLAITVIWTQQEN